MDRNLFEFITKIPKSDLHVHLDGSVRIETLIDLSKQQKLSLPSFTVEGLNELVFKDTYADLVEYLQGFNLVLPIMQSPENLARISYEFAMDNLNEGVCYVEVRFAPHQHVNDQQDIDRVLLSVNQGLNRAKMEYNQRSEVKSGTRPEFNYGIIVCAMRSFSKGISKFFDKFITTHKNYQEQEMFAAASYALVKDCVRIRDKYNLPIVALDLAGPEQGNPPINHEKSYQFARQNKMNLTVHAGEACGPESISEALTKLHPDRIGHGFYLFDQDKITDPKIIDKGAYINQLVRDFATNRITIEVCLTSNLQTIPTLKNIKHHPFAKMLANHLSTTICTDNRTVSKTTVTKELMLATKNFRLTPERLKEIIFCGFKRSFYPGSHLEKRSYLKRISIRT